MSIQLEMMVEFAEEFTPMPVEMREDFAHWKSAQIFIGQFDKHMRPSVIIRGEEDNHTLFHITYIGSTMHPKTITTMAEMNPENQNVYQYIYDEEFTLTHIIFPNDYKYVLDREDEFFTTIYDNDGSCLLYAEDEAIVEIDNDGKWFDLNTIRSLLEDGEAGC
jgi:hypothetical protein